VHVDDIRREVAYHRADNTVSSLGPHRLSAKLGGPHSTVRGGPRGKELHLITRLAEQGGFVGDHTILAGDRAGRVDGV
jgi:hypothetical protein